MASKETLYCLCRKPYDEKLFMIECDICKDWFHGSCVGIQEHQATDIEIYHCPECQNKHGPLQLKKRRNFHRHDYSEEACSSKAVQTGTMTFIKELKSRTFPNADEILLHLRGIEVNIELLKGEGFNTPILVDKKDGLGMTVPPPTFAIQDVEFYVGSMREIDVIDVSRQEDYKMLMREWTEYFSSPNRQKIFNVISLEFSKTRLSELVIPPAVVRQLSWAHNIWPESGPDHEDTQISRPEVQKYCLMGVRDCYTDFHIDFGGTSVWYHVLWGEKIFFLIPPTPGNLLLYEHWVSSANQSEMFFGDQVDKCYKCVVKQGQTVFIPTGWIHAVFTPIDTLVFGGNYLHSLNIGLQLQVYEIERRVKTPEKYLFPRFETMHWYAAKHILETLRDFSDEGQKSPEYLLNGAKALVASLKSWTQRKDSVRAHKEAVPEVIQYGKLLKELAKEVKHCEKPGVKVKANKPEKKKRKKNLNTKQKKTGKNLTQEEVIEKHIAAKNEVKTEEESSPDKHVSLKMRIPKFGAYMEPGFGDDHTGSGSSALKLKVSNGKIVSGAKASPGKFQPFSSSTSQESDLPSDDDNLIVDENPTSMKSKGLKLKFSFGGKSLSDELKATSVTMKQETSQESSSQDEGGRSDLPTIQGGLNGSIADILQASGYGTETDFKIDDKGRSASPAMRDAIQGMLSMSRMGGMQLSSPQTRRAYGRRMYSDDIGDRMPTCYKDDEFVYPTLEADEGDDEFIFKPRGRPKKDETWNPKAKVAPTLPKSDRPVREGVRRESVESGLAVAAANLANKPKPKRPYFRRKSKADKSFLSQSHADFDFDDAQPGTSSGLSHSAPVYAYFLSSAGVLKRHGLPLSPTKGGKKPKKGEATAKQRLGKILKIKKMLH